MKRTSIILFCVILAPSVFGAAFEIPKISIEKIDPEIEIAIPDTDIESFSLLPDNKIKESELDEIWKGMERAKYVSDYDKKSPNFKVYLSEPFSALVVVPNQNSDEKMIHQPSKEFEYNMPIFKPEFKLDPLQKEEKK